MSSYVDDCVLYLHDLVDKMELEVLEFTQMLQEVLFLLEGQYVRLWVKKKSL